MNEVLAIIPARGGSRSIPRKNIRLLNGIPLIAYSIEAGLQAKLVSRVIVTTDDQEVAEVARRFGADVPFIRPKRLAQDTTPDFPVFQHCLNWLEKHEGYKPNMVVQLRPTSPLRPHGSVDKAINLLRGNKNADSVRSIVLSGQNPYKMWRVDQKGYMNPLLKAPGIAEPYNAPRQKLPSTYWQTGHVDAIHTKTILAKRSMSGGQILPLIIDPLYVIDIDTERDWNRAEWLMKQTKLATLKITNVK